MIELILAIITVILIIVFSPTILTVFFWIGFKVFKPIFDYQLEKIDDVYGWWHDRKIKEKKEAKE